MLKRVIKIEKYLGLTAPQEEKDESCHAPENVYEHQIKVLTEDFKQERKDRVAQFERAEKLEMQLSRLKREFNVLGRKCSSLENANRALNSQLYGEDVTSKLFPRYACDDGQASDEGKDDLNDACQEKTVQLAPDFPKISARKGSLLDRRLRTPGK